VSLTGLWSRVGQHIGALGRRVWQVTWCIERSAALMLTVFNVFRDAANQLPSVKSSFLDLQFGPLLMLVELHVQRDLRFKIWKLDTAIPEIDAECEAPTVKRPWLTFNRSTPIFTVLYP
jgi:hypothetical protein